MSVVRRLGVGAVAGAMALVIATPFVGAATPAPSEAAQYNNAASAIQLAQAPGRAAPVPDRCPSAPVTIRGTNGNDRLVGTPQRDVIDGGNGNDVIDGAGGDDLIVGNNGNDTLLGGPGNDVLCGGNGNDVLLSGAGIDTVLGENDDDLVSASFGEDGASGGNGNDLIAGGPGNDELRGDNGDDALGGVDGDDRLAGDNGNDRLAGSEGTDNATGGLGRDQCSAEALNTCEASLASGSRSASVADPVEVESPPAYRLNWSVRASAGIRLVEVYANDALVDHAVVTGASRSGSSTIPVDKLPAGAQVYFYVAVTDANGEQTASDGKVVEVPEQLRPSPPVTTVQLNEPTPIATVVERLAAAGLIPIEYQAEQVPAPAPQIDSELAAQIAAEGSTPYVLPDMGVVYNPRTTPLGGQVEDLTGYYADHQISGTPLISTVLVEGTLNQTQTGPLGTIGRVTGNAPSPTVGPAEPTPNFGPGPDSPSTRRAAPNSLAPSTAYGAEQQEPKTGRVSPEQTTAAGSSAPSVSARARAAADPEVAFWPRFGRLNVATYERPDIRLGFSCRLGFFGPRCGPTLERVMEPRAELQHQLVWTQESLQIFAERVGAYEHNVKVESPGRVGTRPVCSPFSADNFYVRAETVRFTLHNVPDAAELYNDDVIALDPCSSNEVSFGIVYPEKLSDNVPPGQLPFVSVRQESDRNDAANKRFFMAGQSLSRQNADCDRFPAGLKKFCIGLNTSENLQATLARTGGQIGETNLPACVVYSGHNFGDAANTLDDGATLSRVCGQDRDNDGFDDQVDCAPDDPAVNPRAVDIPNDGIDQNCDGSDLTVGSGEIQVTLLWDNDNDQDLHVFEPSGQEIWYSSPGPTATGGRLDRDDNVGVCGRDSEPGGVENIFWPSTSTPARGTYRVDVVQYSSCGTAAGWTAEVRVGNQLIKRETGSGTGTFSFDY